mgnify:CR=1 FL=1
MVRAKVKGRISSMCIFCQERKNCEFEPFLKDPNMQPHKWCAKYTFIISSLELPVKLTLKIYSDVSDWETLQALRN